MLPIKKLYIDSRFKSPDSVSDSDFYIDLPETLLMPEGTGFYLDDISIPVTWYPITENRNNKISDLDEIFYLKNLEKLKILWLADNPVNSNNNQQDDLTDQYRLTIIRNLKNLQKLDNISMFDNFIKNKYILIFCFKQLLVKKKNKHLYTDVK